MLGLKMKHCCLHGRLLSEARKGLVEALGRAVQADGGPHQPTEIQSGSCLILNLLAATLQKYKETGEDTFFTYFNSMQYRKHYFQHVIRVN